LISSVEPVESVEFVEFVEPVEFVVLAESVVLPVESVLDPGGGPGGIPPGGGGGICPLTVSGSIPLSCNTWSTAFLMTDIKSLAPLESAAVDVLVSVPAESLVFEAVELFELM
jgi:hypothetical protein